MEFDEFSKKPEKKEEKTSSSSKDPLNESLYSMSQKLVFVLEDFPPTMALYKRILTGYSLSTATTVEEAIKEIDRLKGSGANVDVMVSDFNLPDGTSAKAIEHMKEVFPNAKIILVSGNDEAEDKIRVDKFVSKEHLINIKEEVEKLL
mgnify:CR=1 FL=1